jgi:FecR protein
MTMIGSGLRLVPALLALLLWAVPSLAQQVGVNSAVNPDASGTPPGGVVRRLVLGQEVLYRERITTQAAGQTQIQFLDESSLTVGPNSDLTIDQFVYNPNTGTGQLAMSAGRGVLRFVGGKLSKGNNPVTMQTPSGTLAVRGGVFLANLTATGQLEVVFLYGKGLEVSAAGQTQTIPRPGFAVSVAGPGAPPSYPFPAPPALLAAFTAALDGRPGGTGGARAVPSDQTVAASGASNVISGDLAASIQQASQYLTAAQPAQINIAGLQQNLQVNTVASQQAISNLSPQVNPPPPPPSAVVLPIFGAAASPFLNHRMNPTAPPFSGPYVGTLTYPGSALQNGSVFVTPADILAVNPSLAARTVKVAGTRQTLSSFVANSVGGGLTLSPLSAGSTNAPVTLTAAGTYNGASTVTRSNGQVISLNLGTVATGTATVTPDGDLFSANLVVNGSSVQQLAPKANLIGSSIFLFGGVPTVIVPTSGIGSFAGTANGTVFNSGAKSVVSGNFNETFNFASRTGSLNITNFGGANYSAAISGFVNGYTGTLTGPASRSGPVTGTFFGPTAAETGGSFQLANPTKSFLASGVFTGR